MNSCKWAEPIFLVLPLSVLYRDFHACQSDLPKISPFTDFFQKDVPQNKSPAENGSAPSLGGVLSIS